MPDIVSRPFKPDPKRACPACCFGAREQHAEWCPKWTPYTLEDGRRLSKGAEMNADEYSEWITAKIRARGEA